MDIILLFAQKCALKVSTRNVKIKEKISIKNITHGPLAKFAESFHSPGAEPQK